MSQTTHFPVINGALCGKAPAPNHASEYDAESPNCPECLKLRKAAEAGTRRAHPWAFASEKKT
jgi:hypothetical protein